MSRSRNAGSERIEYSAISTVAFNRVSGGTLRRPPAAYIPSNTSSRSASTASTTTRIRRIGWSAGISFFFDDEVDIANCGYGAPRIPTVFSIRPPNASTHGKFQHLRRDSVPGESGR